MSSPKVVHITTVHPPSDKRIFHHECRSLSSSGYAVTLLSALQKQAETCSGIRIRPIKSRGGRLRRMIETGARAFVTALRERAHLYHFHDPELIIAGLALKAFGKRVVYDAHENVSDDILTKDYVPAPLRPLVAAAVRTIEQLGVRVFDGVVAATPSIAKQFPREKTVLVQNFPGEEELRIVELSDYRSRPKQAVFAGIMTPLRGIPQTVRAMAYLERRAVPGRLLLAGRFVSADFRAAVEAEAGSSRVDFLGWRDRDDLLQVFGSCRVGLVLFQPAPNHIDAMPNKLFEYMAAGLPVIASDFPLWREIVGSHRCGILVDPTDPEAIASAISWIFENEAEAARMGERGRKAVGERFSWAPEAKKLVALYNSLLPLRAPGGRA
jgi:glycosyltransferase involved in cell wall biosynthesis